MQENKLYLVFEFLSMDLKRYMDSIPRDELMDPMLVKSYLHQVRLIVALAADYSREISKPGFEIKGSGGAKCSLIAPKCSKVTECRSKVLLLIQNQICKVVCPCDGHFCS